MNVEYSKRALSDLHQIAAYYAASDDAAVGEKIGAAIREIVQRIAQAPEWGRPVVQRPGVRVADALSLQNLLSGRRDHSSDSSHPAYVPPAVATRLKTGTGSGIVFARSRAMKQSRSAY